MRVDRLYNSWVENQTSVLEWLEQFVYYYHMKRSTERHQLRSLEVDNTETSTLQNREGPWFSPAAPQTRIVLA